MTRLTALDALGRGFANVRGNPALVLAATLGSVAVLAVVVLGLVPWFASVGVGLEEILRDGGSTRLTQETWMPWLADPARFLREAGAFLLSFGLALTVGSIVFAWYQGGILGVLAAGDAQAPAGAGRPALAFSTWSWRLFAVEATRLVWRVFFFYALLLLLWTVVGIAAALLVGAAVSAGVRSGASAAFGIGCGGALPLLFCVLVLWAGTLLGQSDLPRETSGVLAAVRNGLRTLGRRLGAAVGLCAILFIAALTIGLGFALLDLGLTLASTGWPIVSGVLQLAGMIVQLFVSSWLNLVFAAAFLALLRSERAIEAAAAA